MPYIIAKYAETGYVEHAWGKDHIFSAEDSMSSTFTGKELGVPQLIASFTEAEQWLQKCRELNPSVGYAIISIGEDQYIRNEKPRWHIKITSSRGTTEDDQDEIEYFQQTVEAGPDWTDKDYKIEITYNWRD